MIFTWFRLNQHKLVFSRHHGLWWYTADSDSDLQLNTVRLQLNANHDNPKYRYLDESRRESIE
jgi:hypothetical protein